jgi:hypothetical protein
MKESKTVKYIQIRKFDISTIVFFIFLWIFFVGFSIIGFIFIKKSPEWIIYVYSFGFAITSYFLIQLIILAKDSSSCYLDKKYKVRTSKVKSEDDEEYYGEDVYE